MLAKRLADRGVTVSVGALATGLLHNPPAAAVPALLVSKTITVTALVGAGLATLAETVSAQVSALTEGVIRTMLVAKLKFSTGVVFVAIALIGATVMICQAFAGHPGIADTRRVGVDEPTWHFNSRSPTTFEELARDTDPQAVMKNIAAQTGLAVKLEQRKIKVLTVKKDMDPAKQKGVKEAEPMEQFEVSLLKQEDGEAKDPAASPSHATPTERSPGESLLNSHKVKPTPESLRDFLKSLHGDQVATQDQIQRLINQLGSNRFDQREAASAKLLALAAAPVKELTAALDHPDAEIRRRARTILDEVLQRVPASALLFAALLAIRDRELKGLAAEVLLVVPLCDSQPLRTAASQALRTTVRPEDRALLNRAFAQDKVHVRAIAAAGLAEIDARAEPARAAPVTWVDFLDDTYLVHGRYGGERTDFLKGIPQSLALHFERTTRTANTIDAVVNRHDTSPWLYPVRGKNERPRAFLEAGKKLYPIQGSWRQNWTQWIVLDENGKQIKGGPVQEPHTESCVDFLVVPLSISRTPRQAK